MSAGKVQVYYAGICDYRQELWDYWHKSLPWEERRAAADRYRFEADRRRCICAGMLLYTLLQKEGIKEFTLEKGPFGKPYLKYVPGYHFNLSHSGDFVVCAVGPVPLGADIEHLDHGDPKLAKHFFTDRETDWIMREEPVRDRFIRLWTMKESYCKKTGQGLSLSLSAFEIIPDEGVCPPASVFAEYALPDHHVAVCAEGPVDQVIRHLTLTESL